MAVYENDVLIIPEEYKRMSISEIEEEKARLLKKITMSKRPKKKPKSNSSGIVFKF